MRARLSPLLRRGLPLQPQRTLCSSHAPAPAPPPTPADHRAIAAAQDLLITHPSSPGSPLFPPHGARIFAKLQAFLRAQYAVYGYDEVITPTIYKRGLWETSGHWDNYKDDMFSVSGRAALKDAEADAEGEGEYGLKPMNCPGHCLLFKHAAAARSFRDLPVRYADFAPLHRNELSGALSGLTRVRKFHQDDAHIFCRPVQIGPEIASTLRLITTVYAVFHLPVHRLVLSTRPAHHIGTAAEWDRAEAALTRALDASGTAWTLSAGDGAFYGPKIDALVTDAHGKLHQTATVQLDFQLPRRFALSYLAPAPEAEARGEAAPPGSPEWETSGLVAPVIIHRAVLGSVERFMALLMEHYGGRWPFWLSPRQAVVLPVAAASERILGYARRVRDVVAGVGAEDAAAAAPMSRRTFAVDLDGSANSLAKKVKAARVAGYNHILVVGERDAEAGTVAVETVRGEPGAGKRVMSPEEVYAHFVALEDRYL